MDRELEQEMEGSMDLTEEDKEELRRVEEEDNDSQPAPVKKKSVGRPKKVVEAEIEEDEEELEEEEEEEQQATPQVAKVPLEEPEIPEQVPEQEPQLLWQPVPEVNYKGEFVNANVPDRIFKTEEVIGIIAHQQELLVITVLDIQKKLNLALKLLNRK